MHILSSEDEWQAVEFGHAFHPDVKILPLVTKKIMTRHTGNHLTAMLKIVEPHESISVRPEPTISCHYILCYDR